MLTYVDHTNVNKRSTNVYASPIIPPCSTAGENANVASPVVQLAVWLSAVASGQIKTSRSGHVGPTGYLSYFVLVVI